MPTLDEISLDATRGTPTVEIIFGGAHVGNYRFFLWDARGRSPQELAHGNNIDSIVDAFGLGFEAADLHDHILSFEILVQAAEARPGQVYSVTISVRQDGTPCPGGVVVETGALEDVKALVGFRRFKTS